MVSDALGGAGVAGGGGGSEAHALNIRKPASSDWVMEAAAEPCDMVLIFMSTP